MIADEAAELHQSGIHFAVRRPHADRAVVVLQVAVRRHRAEIDPPPQVCMPEKAVVCFVGVAEHDRLFDLTVNFAHRPDRDGVERAAEQGAARTDVRGTSKARERTYSHAIIDPAGPGWTVED